MNDAIPQFLANTELFAHVPEDALRQIASQCQVQKVYPNVSVFEQGTVAERLYVVYQGSVALRRRDTLTGMEFLLALYGKGKSFGEEGVISDMPYPVSAHATEETHLIALEKADLRRVMQALPQVSIACARIMARRTNRFVAEKGIRYISLSKLQIDPEVLKMLPARMIREHKVLPIAMRGKTLTVAMVDPHNLVAYDEVQRGARDYYVEPVGISESDFLSVSHYIELIPEAFRPQCLDSDAKALATGEKTQAQLRRENGLVRIRRIHWDLVGKQ
jgi:CRP-like cAMP-binding protein